MIPPESAATTVAIAGGGPAGLAAAEAAAGAGARVTVYDRMPTLGRKLLMAGRGGLNLTHGEPLDRFLARYGAAASHLTPALHAFPPDGLRDWAAGIGQATFVGSSGRVFPRSWKASPLLRAWLARLSELGIGFAPGHRWLGFGPDGGIVVARPDGTRLDLRPGASILALGGASWPRLGSDGSWTDILGAAGIAVRPLRPANCGLDIPWSDRFRERFAGTPLKRIALSFGGAAVRGEATVTAHGLEGGAVYALSGTVRDALDRGEPVVLSVDLRPDLDADRLAERLGQPRGRKSGSTFLRKAVGLPPVAIALLREGGPTGPARPPETDLLAARIKALPLRVVGTAGLERAISTAGGIAWRELNTAFMLRARPGVFVAGEMLDWEAPTGGYLLQACFATGRAAGLAAASWAMA